MKKLLGLLLMLPLLLISCSNDDDLPNVKFSVNYEGATNVDGTLYVVQGDTLAFTGIYVTPENTAHKALLANVRYYWDYMPAGLSIVEPFGRGFDTALYPLGRHQVQIVCDVLEEECSLAVANLTFNVIIVENASDIPTVDNPVEGVLNPAAVISNAN